MFEELKERFTEEYEKRKRRELSDAFGRGEVADPISGALIAIGSAIFSWGTAASIAVAVGTSFVMSAFAPKPPTRREGERKGEFPITTSSFGTMIPEGYGHNFDGQGGGVRVAGIVNYIKLRKIVTVSRQQTGGGKGFGGGGRTQEVEQVDYQADLGLIWLRGEQDLTVLWANADTVLDRRTGQTTKLFDPTIPPDDDYDLLNPPDPKVNYDRPIDRHNVDIIDDGDGGGGGTPVIGGYPGLATYPGNATQLPDPTIQAAIDAEYGANSTPAYRHRAYTVLTSFSLAKWGGILPNFTANLQHKTIHTLEDLCNDFCERVGMESGDYDFSAFSGINIRGLLIGGSRYAPREIMDILARVYNVYFYENVDGQLVGTLQDDASVVTIDDSELGWIEGEQESDMLPELDINLPNEIELPRRIDVRFYDPARDFESNLQTAVRQITTGVAEQNLDVEIAMTPDEAREVAQRELYQEHVEGTKHRFQLNWEYLYLEPGRIVTITRDEGFTHSIRVSSITGDIGILNCEGYAVDTAVFTQPATGFGGDVFELPPAGIPAMTICTLMDTPLLRDKDATVNNGAGFYAACTPRTGTDQAWQGASLYVNKVGWERIADFTLPATMGRIESYANLSDSPYVFDNVGEFIVDLYGTTATLQSATEQDVLTGANIGIFGHMIAQWKTAVRVNDGSPNRWRLTGLLLGTAGTESHIGDNFTGMRFTVLNEAVQFVPISTGDLNVEREYKAVTVGQSLDDAATVEMTWTGRSVKPLPPVNIRGIRNSDNDLLIEWMRRGRVGRVLSGAIPLSEETETYEVHIYSGSTLKRIMPVSVGMAMGAVLDSDAGYYKTSAFVPYDNIDGNTLVGTGSGTFFPAHTFHAASYQRIQETGNFVEATLTVDPTESDTQGRASIGLLDSRLAWRNQTVTPAYEGMLSSSGGSNPYTLTIYVAGVSKYTASVANSSRVRIMLSGSEVRFYIGYTGAGSVPVYVSPVAPTYPLRAYATVRKTLSKVENVIMTQNPFPATVYTAAQQIVDFGSIQPSLSVKIYQVSALVGRGQPSAATL